MVIKMTTDNSKKKIHWKEGESLGNLDVSRSPVLYLGLLLNPIPTAFYLDTLVVFPKTKTYMPPPAASRSALWYKDK